MKKITLSAMLLSAALSVSAQAKQDTTGYQFTTVKENKITPVKNQNRSSTCWSFSGLGFLESELMRMGKPETDLSEMFIVYHNWNDKADNFVRRHGTANFGPGGSFDDVLQAVKDYGIVPEEVMKGLNYGENMHVHTELDALTDSYVNTVIKQKKLTPAWKKGYEGILAAYLGQAPEKFTVNGKEHTPQSYAKELGLNADDYVSLTSYTHHPFYTQFAIEIPDNWRNSMSYNVPVNEMMEALEGAVMNGYTVAWASDVSEKGFTRNGIAVVPNIVAGDLNGSDQARWLGLSQKDKDAEIAKAIESPGVEANITQEMRQAAYDNYETTDDHGMQIYGIAKDQAGNKYYMVKNSWGTNNKYEGTWYASDPFVRYKTMSIVMHKDALPKSLKKKLNIK
ncbi:MAG: aminopeptidase C [Bacteroidales bacterium]